MEKGSEATEENGVFREPPRITKESEWKKGAKRPKKTEFSEDLRVGLKMYAYGKLMVFYG